MPKMADKPSVEGTSSGQVGSESLESSIEINIKTLDSRIYTFRVNKHMPIPMLKEKIADATGIPIGQQRLIFRGRVLKDDHQLSEYQLEDGHTLHLVERQPVQAQHASGASSQETARNNVSQGHDSITPNRIAQVSHSVVVGSVNVADQGESMVADIGRLVGAVLNSLGIGASNISAATASNQVPASVETGPQNPSGRTPTGNLGQPGATLVNHPIQIVPQISQLTQVVSPFRPTVIPDSLTTLSEFISRMDLALQSAGPQPSPSPVNVREPPRSDLPFLNQRGVPTPEVLGSTIERARQLLSGNAASALSHIAARLEREGTSTDPVVRGQIQTEAMHVGTAMQHLGAMLLELGRTTMTLRMGQSSAESWVNAGPAVYISSIGPNPIMVQPFPLQASSMFSAPPPIFSGLSGPFGTVDPSRNVNIHIHTGTSVAPGVSSAGNRASSGDSTRSERPNVDQASTNGTSSGDVAPTHGLPSQTVVAAIPARSVAETTSHVSLFLPTQLRLQQSIPGHPGSGSILTSSSGAQPGASIPASNPSQSDIVSTLVAHVNARIASALAGDHQGQRSTSSGMQSTDSQDSHPTTGIGAWNGSASESQEISSGVETIGTLSTAEGQSSNSYIQYTGTSRTREAGIVPSGSISSSTRSGAESCQVQNVAAAARADESRKDPDIGLPVNDSQQLQSEASKSSCSVNSSRSLGKDTTIACSTGGATINQFGVTPSNKSITSLAGPASQSNQGLHEANQPAPLGLGLGGLQPKRRDKTAKPAAKADVSCDMPSGSQSRQSMAMGQQVLQSLVSQSSDVNRESGRGSSGPSPSVGEVDVSSMMSQVLQSPVMNNLLTGVAQQAGLGSPANLRNMLEQCTQSPAINDMMNNFSQQVEGQGQGGIDFSGMIQQMMPVVSQALGRGSTHSRPVRASEPEAQGSNDMMGRDGVLQSRDAQVEAECQNLGSALLGMGRGQGGIDFSSMFQQMMPIMSQVLGRGSMHSATAHDVESHPQPLGNDGEADGDAMLRNCNAKVDLQQVVERIEQGDSPENVFRAELESAAHLNSEGNGYGDLIEQLGNNIELIDEFKEMLQNDIHQKLTPQSSSKDKL